MNLLDQPQIEQLRRRLWNGREFGQAAVMVGAGFSRNAEKLTASTEAFPLWKDLGILIRNSLYLQKYKQEADEYAGGIRLGTSETLRLAEEYETAFGRASLDNLIDLLRRLKSTT